MAAGAWSLVLVGGWRLVAEQFGQGGGPGLVKRCSQAGFYCLQIGSTAVLALGKHTGQQSVHFPRNLHMDCRSRFFYWSVHPPRSPSPVRTSQVLWLMLTNLSLSSWKR